MLDLKGWKSLDFTGTVNATISIALLSLTLHRKGFTTKYKNRTWAYEAFPFMDLTMLLPEDMARMENYWQTTSSLILMRWQNVFYTETSLINTFNSYLLFHPFWNGWAILSFNIRLTANHCWQKSKCKLHLLRPGKHFIVSQYGPYPC